MQGGSKKGLYIGIGAAVVVAVVLAVVFGAGGENPGDPGIGTAGNNITRQSAPANSAPTIASITLSKGGKESADATVALDSVFGLAVSASDKDGDELTYKWSWLPEGALSAMSQTGAADVKLKLLDGLPGVEHVVQVEVSDADAAVAATREFRIVVGECRGGEALDMLQAMNTGHDGSLTTGHANTPRDMMRRLEVMVLMAGMDLPVQAIREQIASAVQIVVQQTRFGDGSRRITSITEITGMEQSTILLNEIFNYQQQGFDENGRVKGFYQATGQVPEFYEALSSRGINVNMDIFRPVALHV